MFNFIQNDHEVVGDLSLGDGYVFHSLDGFLIQVVEKFAIASFEIKIP